MGGGGVTVPGPSAEERALQREQTEVLRQQRDILSRQLREQNLLATQVLFPEAGIQPVTDEAGEIIGFERDETTDALAPLRQDIERSLLERTQAALAGELPVNPALLGQLEEEEQTLRERLLRQLGPGFEVSTPGQEALDIFGRRRSDILEASRRGDLTLAEALSISREQQQQQTLNQMLARIGGVGQFPFQGVGGLAQVAGGFGAAQAPFIQQRGLQTQAAIANAQARAATLGGLFSGIGQLGGSAIGLYPWLRGRPGPNPGLPSIF